MKVKGKEFTINPGGKEIFKNNGYEKIPRLKGIISDNQIILEQLLSVKISGYQDNSIIQQYNIETKNFATNITTHNGLDFHIMQYNKKDKNIQVYTPYSNPAYGFFAHLLCAYYEVFKKRPNINFDQVDVASWNKQDNGMDNPLISFVSNVRRGGNIWQYFCYKEFLKEDKQGIKRIISSEEKETEDSDREGFGLQGDRVIMKFFNDNQDDHQAIIIHIENELIPLYLQAYIDTNLSVSGKVNATNLKKIYEMIYYVIENKVNEKEIDFSGARKNTPLIEEKK